MGEIAKLTLEDYREKRRQLMADAPKFRHLCTTCFQPSYGCYCAEVKPFDPLMKFMILIHPIEVRRRIATGRMSHLCLQGSELIRGRDYSENAAVNRVVDDPDTHSVVLYPGRGSANLTEMSLDERAALFPRDKKLAVFVIDGTWATARPMIRSRNLVSLPRVCFTSSTPSRFRVRKQPKPGCFSTIEAIHSLIELIGEARGFDVASRRHDGLLDVFDGMVERQIACTEHLRSNRQSNFRRVAR